VGQFHWDLASYLSLMRAEIPQYERLQNEVAPAVGNRGRRLLELGTGTGETARRVLSVNPSAVLVGVDSSPRCSTWLVACYRRTAFDWSKLVWRTPFPPVRSTSSSPRWPCTISTALASATCSGAWRPHVAWSHRDLAVLVGES
jgi:hypothetical protein